MSIRQDGVRRTEVSEALETRYCDGIIAFYLKWWQSITGTVACTIIEATWLWAMSKLISRSRVKYRTLHILLQAGIAQR